MLPQEETIKKDLFDTEKINELNRSSYLIRNKDPKGSFNKAEEALNGALKLNYIKGKAEAFNNIGFYHIQVSNHEQGLKFLMDSLEIFQNVNDEIGIANAQYNLAVLQIRVANFALAIEALNKCIKTREKYDDKEGIAMCYFQLAFIHEMFGNYTEALDLGQKCLSIREELKDNIGRAAILNLMGASYTKTKAFGKARAAFMQSMELRKPEDEIRGYFATVFRWIEFLIEINELDEAEQAAGRGLNAALPEQEWFGVLRFTLITGKIEMLKDNNEKAQMYFEEALKLSEERKFKSISYELYELYSELFQKQGLFKEALEFFKKFHKLKEEVLSAQSSSQLKSIQLMNQIESSKREAELERIKNVDLKNAFKTIEEKNRDIYDSINYAQRIQQAILPSIEEFQKLLHSCFVLFKPRDIVSGDFYWLSESGNKLFFAAADCTGHGVPGAFMSMIGSTLLNEIVNEKKILKPSEILFELREGIVRSLKQTGAVGENKDGMDIALCCLDKEKNLLEFSGAHNPLWVVSENGDFKEIAADKQPIGIFLAEKKTFTNHQLQLHKNDAIYVFTDGYADQFGGPKGKKFKYKQLQELIISIQKKEMREQVLVLEQTFNNWKNDLEQLDDVLIVGVKV